MVGALAVGTLAERATQKKLSTTPAASNRSDVPGRGQHDRTTTRQHDRRDGAWPARDNIPTLNKGGGVPQDRTSVGYRPGFPTGVPGVSGDHVDLASSTPPPAPAGVPGAPSRRMLGEAGIDSARRRVHECERPIRLRGATRLVNPATGEIRTLYASAQELDGTTWVPCRNRRAAACEPCSRQYQGDAWQLVTIGLAGG